MGAEKDSPWCSLVIVLHCNNNARGALRFHAFCCAIVALDEAQRAIRLVRKASRWRGASGILSHLEPRPDDYPIKREPQKHGPNGCEHKAKDKSGSEAVNLARA